MKAGLLMVAAVLAFPGMLSAQETLDLSALHSMRTEVNGLEMHALVSRGDKPPLVLVHGSGLSGRYMVPVANALARDFRVYLPDLPGYGLSGDPGEVLGVPGLADWLAAWLGAVDLPVVPLLGNSFGCQVIADLAARHPGRVSHALLQGPTTPPEERSMFWQFVRWRQNQPYNRGAEWMNDVTMQAYKRAGAWRLIRGFHFQITDRIEDKMPRIEAPVLVIRGEHDPITRPGFASRLAELAPRGELVVIPGVAHTLVSVAPGPLAEVVREYLGASARAPASALPR